MNVIWPSDSEPLSPKETTFIIQEAVTATASRKQGLVHRQLEHIVSSITKVTHLAFSVLSSNCGMISLLNKKNREWYKGVYCYEDTSNTKVLVYLINVNSQ